MRKALRYGLLWSKGSKPDYRHHVIAWLFVLATTLPDFFVSVLHIQGEYVLATAISTGVSCFAGLLLLTDLSADRLENSLAEALFQWWNVKWIALVTLTIYAVATEFFSMMSFSFQMTPLFPQWMSFGIGVFFLIALVTLFAWKRRAFHRQLQLETGSVWAMFRLRTLGYLVSVLVVFALAYVGLSLSDALVNRFGGILFDRIFESWLLDSFILYWPIRHLKFSMYQILSLIDREEVPAIEPEKQEVDPRKIDTRSQFSKNMIAMWANRPHYYRVLYISGGILFISLVATVLADLFMPGLLLVQLLPNYELVNAEAHYFVTQHEWQPAFALYRQLQAQSLRQYAYLLYEDKNYTESETVIQAAIQTDPSATLGYLIDGYDNIHLQNQSPVSHDIAVLNNLHQPILAWWLSYDNGNESNASSMVAMTGYSAMYLPYQVSTVPTSIAGQIKLAKAHITHADDALLSLPIEAWNQHHHGTAITLSQEIYGAYPLPPVSTYPIPTDLASAYYSFGMIDNFADNFSSATKWFQAALQVPNGLTAAQTSQINDLLMAYDVVNQSSTSTTNVAHHAVSALAIAIADYDALTNSVSSTSTSAIHAFQAVIAYHDPHFTPYAQAFLALTEYKAGQLTRALHEASQAIASSVPAARAIGYTVSGNIFLDTKTNLTQARRDYLAALKDNPHEYLAWYYTGVIDQAQGHLQRALYDDRKSIQTYEWDNANHLSVVTGAPAEGFGLTTVTGPGQVNFIQSNIDQIVSQLQQGKGK